MKRFRVNEDIRPMSEFRTGIASFLKQIHDTKRPLIITQHGKGVAVLLDAGEYEAMQEKIELLQDIQTSIGQIEAGQGMDHDACPSDGVKADQEMKIIWSPLAMDRVSEIAEYIAQDNRAAAESWIKAVFGKVAALKRFPESGRIVPETDNRTIRELIYGNFLIIYRLEEKRISVLTVRHMKQILPVDEIMA